MNATDLTMFRENTFSFDIAVTQNGAAVDLTGGTLRMIAKYSVLDADADAVFDKSSPSTGITFLSAAGGTANITIASSDTTALPYDTVPLVYDVKFVDSTANVYQVLYGNLVVLANVTRT